MSSESLLPLVKNQMPNDTRRSKNSLKASEEISYGEQLSTFSELEKGIKTKYLFHLERPISNQED